MAVKGIGEIVAQAPAGVTHGTGRFNVSLGR